MFLLGFSEKRGSKQFKITFPSRDLDSGTPYCPYRQREAFTLKPRWADGKVNAQLWNLKEPGQDPCLDQRPPHLCLELVVGVEMCLRKSQDFLKESVLELGLQEPGLCWDAKLLHTRTFQVTLEHERYCGQVLTASHHNLRDFLVMTLEGWVLSHITLAYWWITTALKLITTSLLDCESIEK